MTTVEALASGTPVIATDRGGLGEIARGHAYMIEPTVDSLVDAIRTVLSDEALRAESQPPGARTRRRAALGQARAADTRRRPRNRKRGSNDGHAQIGRREAIRRQELRRDGSRIRHTNRALFDRNSRRGCSTWRGVGIRRSAARSRHGNRSARANGRRAWGECRRHRSFGRDARASASEGRRRMASAPGRNFWRWMRKPLISTDASLRRHRLLIRLAPSAESTCGRPRNLPHAEIRRTAGHHDRRSRPGHSPFRE